MKVREDAFICLSHICIWFALAFTLTSWEVGTKYEKTV